MVASFLAKMSFKTAYHQLGHTTIVNVHYILVEWKNEDENEREREALNFFRQLTSLKRSNPLFFTRRHL